MPGGKDHRSAASRHRYGSVRIAVVGAGISGLTAAYLLQREHQVTVFEKSDHIGGHTLTVDVEQEGRKYAVDTGFVVYNTETYPNFVKLIDRLGIDSQPTQMSFSVRCDASGLEYCGTSLNTIFAQRRNLLNASFLAMLVEILKFNRSAGRAARRGRDLGTLGDFLSRKPSNGRFRTHYLAPLVAAIWSMDPAGVEDFPTAFFLRFMARHRLFQVRDQLEWRVIRGGSRAYVARLVGSLRDGVRTESTVDSVRRDDDGVEVRLKNEKPLRFDHVLMAVHSDQALRMLADPTDSEHEVLGAIGYQRNDAVLHTDTSTLPRNRRAWANWNYRLRQDGSNRPVTTYNMSGLQGLDSPLPFLLPLNDCDSVDPATIVSRRHFSHPVFTTAAMEAQSQKALISGKRRTHYCGAYWGFGFHEDGVVSALDACRDFGMEL
jgi:predicted NAD/FAD-binding protein